jgi:3-phosphoglycerate kinase
MLRLQPLNFPRFGQETIAQYKVEIGKAKTILWNGPVGIFEIPDFATGTRELAEALGRVECKNHYWRRRFGDRG